MNNISQKELGRRIASYRKDRKLTLKQLSEGSGISAGFLSKIENGLCNPSINVIQKICVVLHISINDLAAVKSQDELLSTMHKNESYVLRKNERCLIYGFGNSFCLENIYRGTPGFKVNAMTLTAGNHEQTQCVQTNDNLAMIARGKMCITFDDNTRYDLEEGDSMMIRAEQKYSIVNLSEDVCISYWIEITQP